MARTNEAPAGRRNEQRVVEQRAPIRRRSQRSDPFFIDDAEIPDGMSWEWKRWSYMGQYDEEYQTELSENGWLPVTWEERWPEKRPPGQTAVGLKEAVKRKGQILMQRPMEYTVEAQMEDRENAENQVMDKMRELGQAPAETMTRSHRNLDNHVKREYAPVGMPVPKE